MYLMQKKNTDVNYDYDDDLDIQTFLNETVVEGDIIRLPRPDNQGMLAAGVTTDTTRLVRVPRTELIS